MKVFPLAAARPHDRFRVYPKPIEDLSFTDPDHLILI